MRASPAHHHARNVQHPSRTASCASPTEAPNGSAHRKEKMRVFASTSTRAQARRVSTRQARRKAAVKAVFAATTDAAAIAATGILLVGEIILAGCLLIMLGH